jgi:hypothetical protein
MPEVDSRSVSRIDYDATERVLTVRFRDSGETYRYYGVPEPVYRAFLNAASKGRFLNTHIRDRYDFCRSAA